MEAFDEISIGEAVADTYRDELDELPPIPDGKLPKKDRVKMNANRAIVIGEDRYMRRTLGIAFIRHLALQGYKIVKAE